MIISEKEYIKLLNVKQYLALLENGGVDSWEWHDDSLEEYEEITECPRNINFLYESDLEVQQYD